MTKDFVCSLNMKNEMVYKPQNKDIISLNISDMDNKELGQSILASFFDYFLCIGKAQNIIDEDEEKDILDLKIIYVSIIEGHYYIDKIIFGTAISLMIDIVMSQYDDRSFVERGIKDSLNIAFSKYYSYFDDIYFQSLADGIEVGATTSTYKVKYFLLNLALPEVEYENYQSLSPQHIVFLKYSQFLKDIYDSGRLQLRFIVNEYQNIFIENCMNSVSLLITIIRRYDKEHTISDFFNDMTKRSSEFDHFYIRQYFDKTSSAAASAWWNRPLINVNSPLWIHIQMEHPLDGITGLMFHELFHTYLTGMELPIGGVVVSSLNDLRTLGVTIPNTVNPDYKQPFSDNVFSANKLMEALQQYIPQSLFESKVIQEDQKDAVKALLDCTCVGNLTQDMQILKDSFVSLSDYLDTLKNEHDKNIAFIQSAFFTGYFCTEIKALYNSYTHELLSNIHNWFVHNFALLK